MLYELPHFDHVSVTSLEEAVSCLRKYGERAAILAGGTDILGLMKDGVTGPGLKIPEVLLDIKPIPQLNSILSKDERNLVIGGAVSLTQLTAHDVIREIFPIMAQAARQIGTTQIRNMGTLAGNLCQRPRCMYFRHPHFLCYKKGGHKCFAMGGEHRDYHAILNYRKCAMAHPSDMAPVLTALKATVVVVDSEEEKEIPIEEFFLGPDNLRDTVLDPWQLVKEIQITHPKKLAKQVFLKSRVRHSSDFALSSVALVASVANKVCEDVCLVLGGVASMPIVANEAQETLKGRELNASVIDRAVNAALHNVKSLPMNGYKMDLMGSLVKQALESIA